MTYTVGVDHVKSNPAITDMHGTRKHLLKLLKHCPLKKNLAIFAYHIVAEKAAQILNPG